MRRVLGVLLVGAMVLVGCGTSVRGAPAPASATAAPTGVVLPPRPREVRIDGLDPCVLLTAEQRTALELDQLQFLRSAPSLLYPGGDVPICSIRGYEPRVIAIGLSVVTTTGIELFTSGELAADVRPTEVRGFPAVVAVPARLKDDFCDVIVDVAAGQLLDVTFRNGGEDPPLPQDELCRGAEATADAVMATLLTLR